MQLIPDCLVTICPHGQIGTCTGQDLKLLISWIRVTEHNYFVVCMCVKSYTWCLPDVCAVTWRAEVYQALPPSPPRLTFCCCTRGSLAARLACLDNSGGFITPCQDICNHQTSSMHRDKLFCVYFVYICSPSTTTPWKSHAWGLCLVCPCCTSSTSTAGVPY